VILTCVPRQPSYETKIPLLCTETSFVQLPVLLGNFQPRRSESSAPCETSICECKRSRPLWPSLSSGCSDLLVSHRNSKTAILSTELVVSDSRSHIEYAQTSCSIICLTAVPHSISTKSEIKTANSKAADSVTLFKSCKEFVERNQKNIKKKNCPTTLPSVAKAASEQAKWQAGSGISCYVVTMMKIVSEGGRQDQLFRLVGPWTSAARTSNSLT
ncbi:MAG: hypothetical protein FE78DRAFT_220928, partial [Acidomyces sp. 'richmondensis']